MSAKRIQESGGDLVQKYFLGLVFVLVVWDFFSF